ncbi:hypothetical protein G7054_g10529 [Neopestalotiopsis clavispora]|nr:hypothetical protein G7054_g10529 [Neopestalotiopsis clavispora]
MQLLEIPYAQGTAARHANDDSFRSSRSGFRNNQPWCRTNGVLQFVDESQHIPAIYEDSPESCLEEDETGNSPAQELDNLHHLSPSETPTNAGSGSINLLEVSNVHVRGSELSLHNGGNQALAITNALDQIADATRQTHVSLEIPNAIFGNRSWAALPTESFQVAGHEEPGTSPLSGSGTAMSVMGGLDHAASEPVNSSDLWFELPVFPLQDPTEAKLFRLWIEHGARRFDMCDASRHFAIILPVRAMSCKPLVNALFALSAKFASDVDDYIAAKYYQRCLNSLVPMLDQPAALANEDLFAAVVLLRSFEELEVPLYGHYGETHLLGTHLFIDASRSGSIEDSTLSDPSNLFNSFEFNGLRGAAFLVALRQELFIALVSQRPVLPAFSLLRFNRSLEGPTDDYTWANRIMPFAVDVLDFCYGQNTTSSIESAIRFDELTAYAEQWFDRKPATFNPIYVEETFGNKEGSGERTGCLYPTIWLLNDAVATGLQNYYLVRILLLAYNPHMPRTGPTRKMFLQTENKEMRKHTRTLVGIAKGNPACVPLSVWAAVGIALAGDRFEDRTDQEELMRFLSDAQALSMWDTKSSRVHLAEAWGWDQDAITSRS